MLRTHPSQNEKEFIKFLISNGFSFKVKFLFYDLFITKDHFWNTKIGYNRIYSILESIAENSKDPVKEFKALLSKPEKSFKLFLLIQYKVFVFIF